MDAWCRIRADVRKQNPDTKSKPLNAFSRSGITGVRFCWDEADWAERGGSIARAMAV
jgi:hypothetical protein